MKHAQGVSKRMRKVRTIRSSDLSRPTKKESGIPRSEVNFQKRGLQGKKKKRESPV